MIARLALGVIAVAAIAWLGVLELDQRRQTRGLDEAGDGRIAQGRRDLERAQRANPDPQLRLLAALVRFGGGDPAGAQREIEDVLRDEPDNLTGWSYLIRVTRGRDPQAQVRARAAIGRLDPLSVPGGRPAGG